MTTCSLLKPSSSLKPSHIKMDFSIEQSSIKDLTKFYDWLLAWHQPSHNWYQLPR